MIKYTELSYIYPVLINQMESIENKQKVIFDLINSLIKIHKIPLNKIFIEPLLLGDKVVKKLGIGYIDTDRHTFFETDCYFFVINSTYIAKFHKKIGYDAHLRLRTKEKNKNFDLLYCFMGNRNKVIAIDYVNGQILSDINSLSKYCKNHNFISSLIKNSGSFTMSFENPKSVELFILDKGKSTSFKIDFFFPKGIHVNNDLDTLFSDRGTTLRKSQLPSLEYIGSVLLLTNLSYL